MHHSDLVKRFLSYVMFDTQSAEGMDAVPSSEGQRILGDLLAEELRGIGLADAFCDGHAYVVGTLPANTDRDIPTVALIAHLDTALEVSGADVRPKIVRYDGGDIVLDTENDIGIAETDFPELAKFKGQELIVTDGSTLLGADDKAGIAAIVEAVKRCIDNPDEPHGTVKVVFTPDEEIGHGASLLNLEALKADFAYTVDGGDVGELCWETFNAAKATVSFRGRSVHPGTAKGKMKNANLMLMEFLSKLPPDERPETTEGRAGFFHIIAMHGDVESATAEIIVRDHDRQIFEARKKKLEEIASAIAAQYGPGSCDISIRDQYYNMADKLRDKMYIVEYAREAMRRCGIEPREIPVRGGTDGSALSWRGLPTPNIFTGGMNAHGRQEFIPVPSLEKCCEVVGKLISVIAE